MKVDLTEEQCEAIIWLIDRHFSKCIIEFDQMALVTEKDRRELREFLQVLREVGEKLKVHPVVLESWDDFLQHSLGPIEEEEEEEC